jgi:hypothetical protein
LSYWETAGFEFICEIKEAENADLTLAIKTIKYWPFLFAGE